MCDALHATRQGLELEEAQPCGLTTAVTDPPPKNYDFIIRATAAPVHAMVLLRIVFIQMVKVDIVRDQINIAIGSHRK